MEIRHGAIVKLDKLDSMVKVIFVEIALIQLYSVMNGQNSLVYYNGGIGGLRLFEKTSR